ncbi:MAG: SpoIIIAH-like family protein [Clostridia bacterium]|nr:SpoIIIAH-like family protein [Clostridia bacterium]MBQ9480811.1 SpoIIIAH-like family protein [Clostridia bacterium]
MSKKKKIIILSCMIALLAVTAVFNFLLTKPTSNNAVTAANYFTQYRTERTSSRNEQILQLDAIIASSDSSAETLDEALDMKLKLTALMEQELLLENLIKARGYEDAVVTIGLTSGNINVIVKDADFVQDDAVAIYTILQDEASATPENVKIIPVS